MGTIQQQPKRQRRRTEKLRGCLIIIAIAVLVIFGGWVILREGYGYDPLPFIMPAFYRLLPSTASEHTFEAAEGTSWDTELGLVVSVPPGTSTGPVEVVVERSAPRPIEEKFIALFGTYDVSLNSAPEPQEHPLVTLYFEIPRGVDPNAMVILQWINNEWALAQNQGGSPGGEISQDGQYIWIARENWSKYRFGSAEWLYMNFLQPLDRLPEPPPPSPVIEAKKTYTDPLGYQMVDVYLESPMAIDLSLHWWDIIDIDFIKVGGMWYSVKVQGNQVDVKGPTVLAPGLKHTLNILFPTSGGQAEVCLDTSDASLIGRAAFDWTSRLGLPNEEISSTISLLEMAFEHFERYPEGVWSYKEGFKELFRISFNLVKDLIGKELGWSVKYFMNAVPVSVDIATFINARIDYRPDPCIEVTALPSQSTENPITPPQETAPPIETPPPTETVMAPTATPILTDRIAFVSDRDGNQEIYLMELVGSNVVSLTNLTNNPADDFAPVWSPNGARLAFRSLRDGNPALFVMRADGSSVTRISDTYGGYSWSPDSEHIAFSYGSYVNENIFIANLDGSGLVRLTESTVFDDRDPSWSLDGKSIIFSRASSIDFRGDDIYISKIDDSSETFLLESGCGIAGNYTWLPDNKHIAFQCYPPGGEDPTTLLKIINISDTDIAPTEIRTGRNITFSPDFTHIATSLPIDINCDYIREACFYDIFLIDINNSSAICLTCNNPADDQWPAWSPDGTRIAFMANRNGNLEIFVMNSDGSNLINLTNNPASDSYPVWAPIPIIYLNVSESTAEATNPPPSLSCPGALPTRLKAGGYAYVSLNPPLANRVRNGPGKNYSVAGSVQPGKIMEITDGPECADNWVWWKIRELETNLIGWTAEGDNQGYWLVPCVSEIECGNH